MVFMSYCYFYWKNYLPNIWEGVWPHQSSDRVPFLPCQAFQASPLWWSQSQSYMLWNAHPHFQAFQVFQVCRLQPVMISHISTFDLFPICTYLHFHHCCLVFQVFLAFQACWVSQVCLVSWPSPLPQVAAGEKVILKHSYIHCFTLASLLFRRLIYTCWSNLNILDGFLPLLMPVPPRRWHTRGGAPKTSSPEAWFKMSIFFSVSFLSQPHLIPQRVEKHSGTSMSSTLVKKLDGAHVSHLRNYTQSQALTTCEAFSQRSQPRFIFLWRIC